MPNGTLPHCIETYACYTPTSSLSSSPRVGTSNDGPVRT